MVEVHWLPMRVIPLREHMGKGGREQTENLSGGCSQPTQCWQETTATKPGQGSHWAP